jgi:hypothetical protein
MNKEVEVLRGDSIVSRNYFIFKVNGYCIWWMPWGQIWVVDKSAIAEWLFDWRKSSPLELLVLTGIGVEKVSEHESKSL